MGVRVAPKTRADLEIECRRGRWGACFALGRKPVMGFFAGVEGARFGLTSNAHERTGLSGGWAVGPQLGVEFFHFLPLNLGMRFIVPEDERPLVRDVAGGTESSGIEAGMMLRAETGFQHTFRLAPFVGILPALLVGYAGVVAPVSRTFDGCSSCARSEVSLGGGPYVAGLVRFHLHLVDPFIRYEQHFAGDFSQAFVFGLDLAAWAALLVPDR
jgi:hypothetical protein